jgi:uncharacterized protein (TIGR03437 family)
MPRAAVLLVAVLAGLAPFAGYSATREAPSYSAATIVNAASYQPGSVAPNTFLTIYGTNLAYTTKAISESDIHGNTLPTILPGTGVSIYINRIRAHIYYVSPTQINILVPSDAAPGPAELLIAIDGIYGPSVMINLQPTAPALFQMDNSTAIAVHADSTLLTPSSPGRPGEDIVLYATGLGTTSPAPSYGQIPMAAARIKDSGRFRVLFDGVQVDPARVAYAGVSPGFAGLYQVNIKLPDDIKTNPEVRIQAGDAVSKAGIVLPIEGQQ